MDQPDLEGPQAHSRTGEKSEKQRLTPESGELHSGTDISGKTGGQDCKRRFVSTPFFLVLAAIAAALVINAFFCPRFVLWNGLNIPSSWFNPEVNRAVDTLHQVENPFGVIANPSNSVIRWRLLFPVVLHLLHAPPTVFLVLPQLGCLLVLGWIAQLTLQETNDRRLAFGACILFGASSWFFVSMGWLSYLDSWYVLGLLIAAFHPSTKWLVVSCLLTPWIDERFVLALPMTLGVRALFLRRRLECDRAFIKDALTCLATITPWLIFRVSVVVLGYDTSPSATQFGGTLHRPGIVLTVVDGLWNGLRGGWYYAIIPIVLAVVSRSWTSALYLMGTTLAAIGANLGLAGDISRSASNLIPLAIFGFFETSRQNVKLWRPTFWALVAFNLICPAAHVVTSFKIPISRLPTELARWSNPPPEVNPHQYLQEGLAAKQNGDLQGALYSFSQAIRLSEEYAEAHMYRGMLLMEMGNSAWGLQDIHYALVLKPDLVKTYPSLSKLAAPQKDEKEAK